MSYRFHPAALQEHRAVVAYYNEQRSGLGRRYVEAFQAAIDKICNNPERFRIIRPPDIRRLSLDTFPYFIIYRVHAGTPQVLAVAHKRREPEYWSRRA